MSLVHRLETLGSLKIFVVRNELSTIEFCRWFADEKRKKVSERAATILDFYLRAHAAFFSLTTRRLAPSI